MAGQWDPYTVLNINKTRSRCYGWAPSKGRLCENPISMLNHNEAHRLISRIARLSPSDEEVMELLSHVARCLLCRNPHQDQATSVLDRWEQRIDIVTETSTVEGDEEEDEEEERIESEEGIPSADRGTQMTEIHEILRRIEAALVANQRRVEISTSADSIQSDSDSRPEIPPSGSHTNEAADAGLSHSQSSLHHIDVPVRQPSREDVNSRNSSPQTLTGDNSNKPESIQQTTNKSFLAAVTLPETDYSVTDRDYDDRSSDTVIEGTLLGLELERAEMGPSSSEVESKASTATAYPPPKNDVSEKRHDIFGHGFRLPDATLQARWNTNPLWLTILIVYIGAVTFWDLLGRKETYLPFLGLPQPGLNIKHTAAEPLRLDGPSPQSLEMLKCY